MRRSVLLMASGTVLSRVTGLARTAVLAAAMGVSDLADAYNTANTLPTMLFTLVSGGTLSAVLVPLLAQEPTREQRRERAELVGGTMLLITAALTLVVAVAAPWIIRVFTLAQPDGAVRQAFVAVASHWLVLFAPQVLAYGISVHAVAVLQAERRLVLAGFAPIATNLITIAAGLAYIVQQGDAAPTLRNVDGSGLLLLGVGTTAGVAAMALIQAVGARRALHGMRLLRFAPSHPVVGEMWRLGRWMFVYVGLNQVGLIVVLTLANAAAGGVAAYQWAFMIMQLPYAVIGVSLLSWLLPGLAQAAGDNDSEFATAFSAGLRLTIFLLLPAAVCMVVLARPIVDVLLGYGAARAGTETVALALRAFGVALVPFAVFQALTRSCYARRDTRTPALVNIAVNAVNVGGAALAFALLDGGGARLTGLVLAYGLSYATGVLVLGRRLARRVPSALRGTGRTLAHAGAAGGALAGALLMATQLLREPTTTPGRIAILGVYGLIAGLVYLAAAWVLRTRELLELLGRHTQQLPRQR